MRLFLLIILIFACFGGGGYSYRNGNVIGGGLGGSLGILLLILLGFILLGGL